MATWIESDGAFVDLASCSSRFKDDLENSVRAV